MLPLCTLMSMETEKLVGIGTLVVLLSRWLKVIAALGTGGKR
ncbi:unnamed protein product [Brassica oleracea var. botrytis]